MALSLSMMVRSSFTRFTALLVAYGMLVKANSSSTTPILKVLFQNFLQTDFES
jgi:hypothetical protein